MALLTYSLTVGALVAAALLAARLLPLPKKVLVSKWFNNPMLVSLLASAATVAVLAFAVPGRNVPQASFVAFEDDREVLLAEEPASDEETLLVAGKPACAVRKPTAAMAPYRPAPKRTSAVALLLSWLGVAVTSALVISAVKPTLPPPAP